MRNVAVRVVDEGGYQGLAKLECLPHRAPLDLVLALLPRELRRWGWPASVGLRVLVGDSAPTPPAQLVLLVPGTSAATVEVDPKEGETMLDEYRHVLRDHVFDKCWELDITWSEVEQLLDAGEVIEEYRYDAHGERVKQVRLLLDWKRPLHVVYEVYRSRKEVVFITIYEARLAHWKPGYRERRR